VIPPVCPNCLAPGTVPVRYQRVGMLVFQSLLFPLSFFPFERRDGGGVEGTGRRGSDPQEKAGGAQAASGSRSRRSDEELPVLWALAAVVALGGVFAFGVRARRRTRANAVQ